MNIIRLLCIISIVTIASVALNAQEKIIRRGGNGIALTAEGDMVDVPEIASIIVEKNEKIIIGNVFDAKMRPKENESVDVKEGDAVLMVNGTRVKSLKDVKTAYTSAEIGSTIKLGVQRKEEMMIVSFIKSDPEKLPKRRIVMRNNGGGGDEDVMIISGIGLLVGSKKNSIVVQGFTDESSPANKGGEIKEGDNITAVNNTKVSSFKKFAESFKKIPVGDKVTFSLTHGGKERAFSFIKAEAKGQRVIKRTN